MSRHADCLAEADSDDALLYCIAAGDVALAVRHLTSRGHLSDAMLVAAAADEGSMLSSDRSRQQRRLRKMHTEDCDQQNRRFCSWSYIRVVFWMDSFYWKLSAYLFGAPVPS